MIGDNLPEVEKSPFIAMLNQRGGAIARVIEWRRLWFAAALSIFSGTDNMARLRDRKNPRFPRVKTKLMIKFAYASAHSVPLILQMA